MSGPSYAGVFVVGWDQEAGVRAGTCGWWPEEALEFLLQRGFQFRSKAIQLPPRLSEH